MVNVYHSNKVPAKEDRMSDNATRAPCTVPPLVRWLLRRICRKLVVQGPEHAGRITEYYRIMRAAAEAEFTEDNDPTLTAFLRECWDTANTKVEFSERSEANER